MMLGPLLLLKPSNRESPWNRSYKPATATFTQFYLKDVAWADPELYHLRPVVAAQQIHK